MNITTSETAARKPPLGWVGISLCLGALAFVEMYYYLSMNDRLPASRISLIAKIVVWVFVIAQPAAFLLGVAAWRTWQGKLSILCSLVAASYELYQFLGFVAAIGGDLPPSS